MVLIILADILKFALFGKFAIANFSNEWHEASKSSKILRSDLQFDKFKYFKPDGWFRLKLSPFNLVKLQESCFIIFMQVQRSSMMFLEMKFSKKWDLLSEKINFEGMLLHDLLMWIFFKNLTWQIFTHDNIDLVNICTK